MNKRIAGVLVVADKRTDFDKEKKTGLSKAISTLWGVFSSFENAMSRHEIVVRTEKLKFLMLFAEHSEVLRRECKNDDNRFGKICEEIFADFGQEYNKRISLRMRNAGLFLLQAREAGVKVKFSSERQIRDFLQLTATPTPNGEPKLDFTECVDAAKELSKHDKDVPHKATGIEYKSIGPVKELLVEKGIGNPQRIEAERKKIAAKEAATEEEISAKRVEKIVKACESLNQKEWDSFCEIMGLIQNS